MACVNERTFFSQSKGLFPKWSEMHEEDHGRMIMGFAQLVLAAVLSIVFCTVAKFKVRLPKQLLTFTISLHSLLAGGQPIRAVANCVAS